MDHLSLVVSIQAKDFSSIIPRVLEGVSLTFSPFSPLKRLLFCHPSAFHVRSPTTNGLNTETAKIHPMAWEHRPTSVVAEIHQVMVNIPWFLENVGLSHDLSHGLYGKHPTIFFDMLFGFQASKTSHDFNFGFQSSFWWCKISQPSTGCKCMCVSISRLSLFLFRWAWKIYPVLTGTQNFG